METKTCTTCRLELPKSEFAGRTDKKTPTLQSSCKKCHSKYRKEHYQANKAKYIFKAKKYNKSIFTWFLKLRENLKCEDCGENRYWLLDFHHNDPSQKEGNVVLIARSKGSKKKVLEEIEKCTVLCSNCHRDLHYKERIASISGDVLDFQSGE